MPKGPSIRSWLIVCSMSLCSCATHRTTAKTGALSNQNLVPAAPVDQPEIAKAKFLELSKELEKLGAEDTLQVSHLQQQLEAVLQADNQHSAALFDLTMLTMRHAEPQATKATLERIVAHDPNFVPAKENLLAMDIDAGLVEQALPAYQAIVAQHPKNQTSRLVLARLFVEQKKYHEAIALCREVLQRQADSIEAFHLLAQSYHAMANLPMTELIIARGLKISPHDVTLHRLLAQVMFDRDNLALGVAKLKEIIATDPNQWATRAQFGDIALAYRDFGNAKEQYEAILNNQAGSLANANDLLSLQLNLAVAYKGLGQYAQAEKLNLQVLAQSPDYPLALWNLAILYKHNLQRYEDATHMLERYEHAAGTDPQHLEQVKTLLAELKQLDATQKAQAQQVLHEQQRQQAAEAVCAALAKGQPPHAELIGTDADRTELAWKFMNAAQQAIAANHLPEGEAEARCALAIMPTSTTTRVTVCAPMYVVWTRLLYQMGQLPEANKAIHEAVVCDPNSQEAQLIVKQLQELGSQEPKPQEPKPPKPKKTGK